jgi:hypothetical protein
MVGAAALYDLGKRMTSPAASLVGVGYYLFMPFNIRASRSFQPDPMLVMFIVLAVWAFYRWSRERSWMWASLAGLLGGLSGYIKPAGLFFCGGILVGVVLYDSIRKIEADSHQRKNRTLSLFSSWGKSQVWLVAGLMGVVGLSYYLVGIWKGSTGGSLNWTILDRWREILDPSFFIQWMLRIDDLMILSVVAAGIVGTLVSKPENRAWLFIFRPDIPLPYPYP